jgi:hypothetical protein
MGNLQNLPHHEKLEPWPATYSEITFTEKLLLRLVKSPAFEGVAMTISKAYSKTGTQIRSRE